MTNGDVSYRPNAKNMSPVNFIYQKNLLLKVSNTTIFTALQTKYDYQTKKKQQKKKQDTGCLTRILTHILTRILAYFMQ